MLFNDRSAGGEEGMPGVPLVPLRDLVVFPHMVVPLIVGRATSRAALRAAERGDQRLFLVAQKDAGAAEPGPDDLHEVGCVGRLIQLVELPDGNLKALVEGVERARVAGRVSVVDHVRVEPQPDYVSDVAFVGKADPRGERIPVLQDLHRVVDAPVVHHDHLGLPRVGLGGGQEGGHVGPQQASAVEVGDHDAGGGQGPARGLLGFVRHALFGDSSG